MSRQIFASAFFAGIAAGVVAFLLQYAFINPLIIEGELYEQGLRVHFATSLSDPVQSPAGLDLAVERDLSRDLQSFGFSLISYTAFALILVAVMALAVRQGRQVTARQGIVWGLAGFVALQLAPAFGLPPELPGTVAAEIGARQAWWIGCVISTAAGLGLIGLGSGWVTTALGAGLLLLPHLIGAPHLDTYFGIAPPELSARFVSASLGVAALSWATLGLVASQTWTGFETRND